MRTPILQLLLLSIPITTVACSASGEHNANSTGGTSSGSDSCGQCIGKVFTPCNANGTPGDAMVCPDACVPGIGCTLCAPGGTQCVGNEVRSCSDDGSSYGETVEVCDVANGAACSNGKCTTACILASDQPSNVGCEFWAVDLDQQDGFNDPASAPWGVAISNAGQSKAHVTIELNSAPYGQAPVPQMVWEADVNPGDLYTPTLPTRELDCGVKPNDYASPGTCLSSNAYRITSTAPIVVYQFNVFENAFSNDASLLIPTSGLGQIYRIINWPAGHPVKIDFPGLNILDRSYVTIVGTKPNTQVKVKPSWRIKGNPPIAATPAGGEIITTLGPFDVLNLETDDATLQDDPKTVADLTSTIVISDKPVAVFSGVESTSAPGGVVDIPTYSGWNSDDTCCLDHLEDQMFPVESVGKNYVISRSPVRSTSGWREPDVIRFLGVAETATVTTSLPSPYNSFTLGPGEVKTTWAQDNFTVVSDKPVMVGQLLISNQYVDGPYIGDPSLTVFPPVDQYRTEYVIPTPPKWTQHFVVITAEVTAEVTIDGASTFTCAIDPVGVIDGKTYETRKCILQSGAHRLTGEKPFGIIAYGYGSAGSYAFAGGADVKRVYEPPPLK